MSFKHPGSKAALVCWIILAFGMHLFASKTDSWTVLIYMAADNNLAQAAIQNINDMEAADLPSNLNLVLQSDLPQDSSYPGGQRRLIQADNSPLITSPLLQELGEINSGDPNTLYSFAAWGFKRYPSDKKALIIWGHGNSWFKSGGKWICPDDGAQSLISVSNGQLQSALLGLPKLDILILDACSMQSVEVLTELKTVAEIIIGSEDELPSSGFPYQDILGYFDGNRQSETIAAEIVDAFLDSYNAGGSQNPEPYSLPVTCSAVKMAEYDLFLQALKSFSIKYRYRATELLALRDGCYEMNHGYCDVDIFEYFSKVNQTSSDTDLCNDALAVLNAWNAVQIHKGNLGHADKVGAAAIWFPWHWQYFESFWTGYIKLDFSQYRWISLLFNAFGMPQLDVPTPQLISQSHSLGSHVLKLALQEYPDDTSLQAIVEYEDETKTYDFELPWRQSIMSIRVPIQKPAKVSILRLGAFASASMVLELEPLTAGLSLQTHPNPVQSKAEAKLRWYIPTGLAGKAVLELFNSKGQKLGFYDLGVLPELEGSIRFSDWPILTKLSSGIYHIRLKIKGKKCSTKLTIL